MKKKIIIGILIVAIIFILSLIVVKVTSKEKKHEMKTTSKIAYYNSNDGVIKDVEFDGILVENINLELNKKKSVLTAYVTNKTSKDISIRIIYIHVKDKKGKLITTLRAYTGTLQPSEKKKISSKVNRNLENAYSFEYELVKE